MPHHAPASASRRSAATRARAVAASMCGSVRRLPWLAALLVLAGCDLRELPLPHDVGSPAERLRGQALLSQYQCGSCHAIAEVPMARGAVGPSLDRFGRRSYIAGHLPNGRDMLARWIVAPAELVPGTAMPSMGVSPADARDMAAYLLATE